MEYIIGIGVSLLVQIVKKLFGTDSLKTMTVLFVLSLVGAVAVFFLKSSPLWEPMLQILMMASAFHNVIIRRFESA